MISKEKESLKMVLSAWYKYFFMFIFEIAEGKAQLIGEKFGGIFGLRLLWDGLLFESISSMQWRGQTAQWDEMSSRESPEVLL